MANQITIIGGGLAGMTAALRLAQRGCHVTIYELKNQLGGKAGSLLNPATGVYSDHGYHIFPTWYHNLRAMANELGIFPKNLWESNTFLGLQKLPPGNTDLNFIAQSPTYLYIYSLADLLSRPDNYLRYMSLYGFLQTRFYMTANTLQQHQDLVLKALSDPSYDVSALTTRNMWRQWLPMAKKPTWSALRGSLQQYFIQPIQTAIEDAAKLAGNDTPIKLNHKLTGFTVQNQRVTEVVFLNMETQVTETLNVRDQTVILAIPSQTLRGMLDDSLFQTTPLLFGLDYLKTAPQAGLDLYLKRKLPNIPQYHFSLWGSDYAQTLFDITQTWDQFKDSPVTIFQSVAAGVIDLLPLSEEAFKKALIADIMQYVPFSWEDVDWERTVLQTNVTEPLFMNDVGSYEKRPYTHQTVNGLENLYLAGDYCHTYIDVASMEGAVTSGMMAAEAVRKALNIKQPVKIKQPRNYPRWFYVLMRKLFMPAAFLLKLSSYVSRR